MMSKTDDDQHEDADESTEVDVDRAGHVEGRDNQVSDEGVNPLGDNSKNSDNNNNTNSNGDDEDNDDEDQLPELFDVGMEEITILSRDPTFHQYLEEYFGTQAQPPRAV